MGLTMAERLHRLAQTASDAIARADEYRSQRDEALRIIAAQERRIEELSRLLGEKPDSPGEVRA